MEIIKKKEKIYNKKGGENKKMYVSFENEKSKFEKRYKHTKKIKKIYY